MLENVYKAHISTCRPIVWDWRNFGILIAVCSIDFVAVFRSSVVLQVSFAPFTFSKLFFEYIKYTFPDNSRNIYDFIKSIYRSFIRTKSQVYYKMDNTEIILHI